MKKNLLLAGCFLAFGISHAQESLPILPFSSVSNINDYESSLIQAYVDVPHLAAIKAEDVERDHNGKLYRVGVIMPVDFTFSNTGTWSVLPNGDKVWRMQITAPDAKGTSLYFDRFYLPAGARMHVYSPDRQQMLGAFTSYNNHESGLFATSVIGGESCIVEYYEPVEVSGQGYIHLNEVNYVYRSQELFVEESAEVGSMRASDPCEVDVKCPEGTAWADQIRGVCRILVKAGSMTGYCSGSAINNTAQDCTPYILSAQHCAEGTSTADFNQWIFRFNYQKANCGSGTSVNNSMTGAALKANSNDLPSLGKGDFILCQTNNAFPASYNIYLNGWDNQNIASSSGVSIHHPAGDFKKISTYSSALISSTWSGTPGTHWRVTWVATTTNHGVTEGGSSGSPIFNSSKLICGQLSGGSSYCSSPSSPDLYGKTSYCWTSAGTTSNRQLKPWLDPLNSGVSTLSGKNNVCTTGEEEFALENIFSMYPNPATDELTIESTGFNESVHTVAIYDQTGKLVNTFEVMPGMMKKTISLQNLNKGVYNVVITNGTRSTSRKFVKM